MYFYFVVPLIFSFELDKRLSNPLFETAQQLLFRMSLFSFLCIATKFKKRSDKTLYVAQQVFLFFFLV